MDALIKVKSGFLGLNPKYQLNPEWVQEQNKTNNNILQSEIINMKRKYCPLNSGNCIQNCVHYIKGYIVEPKYEYYMGEGMMFGGHVVPPRCK